jgi:hypothetical protein
MEQENLYDKIQEILGNLRGNFNVLEEQINIDTQLEYFESSKGIKNSFDSAETLNTKENLFSIHTALAEKKTLLSRLASINDVEAFRALERYKNNPDPELKDWAILAMQESRMLLESNFLDENQVFISTGLGGKGLKLRYFVVFLANENVILSNFQKKITKNETEFIFKKYDAEIEEVKFSDIFVTVKSLIPLSVHLNNLFEEIVTECNQFGDFLQSNFIVTNVKELEEEEIYKIIESAENTDDEDILN